MSVTTSEDGVTNNIATRSGDKVRLRDISSTQWKAGMAAVLGWMFDGLDMHLYTLVAAPLVAKLMVLDKADPNVTSQLVDRRGNVARMGHGRRCIRTPRRSPGAQPHAGADNPDLRGLYRAFILCHRLVASFDIPIPLGFGHRRRMGRRVVAAVRNVAFPLAALGGGSPPNRRKRRRSYRDRNQRASGVGPKLRANRLSGWGSPALLVFWIRRSVPEPAEWVAAKSTSRQLHKAPRVADLFRGDVRRTTLLTIVVCACALTAWWAFMFWNQQHVRNLPDLAGWDRARRERLVSLSFFLVIFVSVGGNFFAALLSKLVGYRKAIALMCLGFFVAMAGTYLVPRDHVSLLRWLPWVGFFSGVFGLFTMYLPPLFPTLLRTTGAGFSYNIGRVAAAGGTIFFGLFHPLHQAGDFRVALLYNSFLFLPAAGVALLLPDLSDKSSAATVPAETAR